MEQGTLFDGLSGWELQEPVPSRVPQRCQPGQIWQLGKHRLACMDAFHPATYDLLLPNHVRLSAIIADPPYGMRLDASYSHMQCRKSANSQHFTKAKGKRGEHSYGNVMGDWHDFDASFLVSHFVDVQEQFWFGANYYAATLGDTMRVGSWLVWDKRELEAFDKMFGSCFELIWSRQKHKQDILRHRWASIFGTEREPGMIKRQHPTQKPVPLIEDIITRYTDEAAYILDPFLGSGTSIIAALRTKRVVYGCEISPEYCDIILHRWEKATGQYATLEALERLD